MREVIDRILAITGTRPWFYQIICADKKPLALPIRPALQKGLDRRRHGVPPDRYLSDCLKGPIQGLQMVILNVGTKNWPHAKRLSSASAIN